MQRISDALELLTGQHQHIFDLVDGVRQASQSERATAVSELVDYVTAHLAVEQELFYPRLASWISPSVHEELLLEHGEIKRVLADLLWLESDDPEVDRRLASLVELLSGHAMWQDEELFTAVAEGMPAEVLAALGAHIHAHFDSLHDVPRAA
ncbi:MAG TPA: hemerythrin domain-containing protein [Kofleriaceae bacterium]|nr:hemerythrin domain-containing protein [Kofleriaceae bacterium]